MSEVSTFTHTDITHPRDIFLQVDDSDTAFVTDVDEVVSLDVSNVLSISHLDTLTAGASSGHPGEEFSRLLETVAADAYIKAINTKSVYADAYIKAIQDKTITADAFIDALRKTVTADVFVDALRKTLTADAYIDPIETFIPARMPVSYYTATYLAQYAKMSVVEVDDGSTTSNTISAIMSIVSRLTKPVTADAFIRLLVAKTVTSDAFIDALTKTVTSDAFITALTKIVTADAFIRLVQQKLITSDAFIKAIQQKPITADTFIRSLGRVISNVHLFASMMLRRR